MTDSRPYDAAAVIHDGALSDIRLTQAGKSRHLFGRSARHTELALADALAAAGPGRVLPVLLGSGLGHALAALRGLPVPPGHPPDAPRLVVVDREAPVLALTGLRAAHAADPGLAWLDAPDPAAVLADIRALCAALCARPVALAHPAYQRLDPGYYGALLAALCRDTPEGPDTMDVPDAPAVSAVPRAAVPDPLAACRTARFTGDMPRVLVLTTRLFLSGEVLAACGRLGAPCRYLSLGADEMELGAFLGAVAAEVAAFRPDFVLTFNHLGLDREGYLSDALERMELPLASWFADDPALILGNYARPFPPLSAAFTWDADTVPSLAAAGCRHAFHLPLAADATRFRPLAETSPGHPFAARVSFLGNSMLAKTRSRLAFAAPHPDLAAALTDMARAFGQSPERGVRAFLSGYDPGLFARYLALGEPERLLAFETAVVWEATRLYRRDCLARVMPFFPTIAGDPGWLETFPDAGTSWRHLPELSYYDQVPQFYPRSEINLNVTSRQMKGAVNQRVFDVPACGAFLVTDRQEQMDALFEPGRETAVYAHPDELPDMVRHYLAHPRERERLAAAARRRVLAEHTYDRRMRTLFAAMRRLFAKG